MIVEDRYSSCGMFSKAGRLSLEMYTLLQEKDFILNNRKKTFNINEMQLKQPQSQSRSDISSKSLISKHASAYNLMSDKQVNYTKSKDQQPFGQIVSREHFTSVQDKQRQNNQKFGMYNPKYHLIFQRSPLYEDKEFNVGNKQRIIEFREKILFDNQKQSSRSPSKKRLNTKTDQQQKDSFVDGKSQITSRKLNESISESVLYLGIDFDKPKKKVVGPIEFSKQKI